MEAFALANDTGPRTGLTALHGAASRGHLSVVRWRKYDAQDCLNISHISTVIEDCGAVTDLEDREGETALHKAALQGNLEIVKYLLNLRDGRADVHATDRDGWTALHNACSKGYLDIVKWLCENGGAATVPPSDTKSVRGVDRKASSGGWTPLMNAASKGHLPVVRYLLTKQGADPLIRNDWGETAADVAAAVFEVFIVQLLEKAEGDRWRTSSAPYNSLAVHTTVPLILYENQHLDARLKTLAMSSGRPKFTAAGLGRKGRRSPFELKLPPGFSETPQTPAEVPAWRSDIQLPLLEDPYQLPSPKTPVREGAERSHFWLSDWTLDLTHPKVGAEDGWQYARSFNDPEDQWTAEIPPILERLLSTSGTISPGAGLPQDLDLAARQRHIPPTAWVRRRRWVRVMRRRLDIAPLSYLQPDGNMYALSESGVLVLVTGGDPEGGQELGTMPTSFLSRSKDYVARARYLAGSTAERDASTTSADVRRGIAKLERAVLELRTGMLAGDENDDRKTQAEVLLNAFSRELERRRLAAGVQGITLTNDRYHDEDISSDDESTHYPSSMRSGNRPSSIRSGQTPDYFSRPSTSRLPADLTPQLQAAPEFRVPTHEAPQKVSGSRVNTPTPHSMHAVWERDESVGDCRGCHRRFTLFFRKHCRRCGRIFCDRCSSFRAALDPVDVVLDPFSSDSSSHNSTHRVCQTCFDQSNATIPSALISARTSSLERIVLDSGRLIAPSHSAVSSQVSDLAECPVCSRSLADIGTVPEQEAHVRNCLEGGSGALARQTGPKYLVYRLPPDSPLVGTECVICLEEFAKGSLIARLSCLCTFHNSCLSAWLQRGRSCPVHARDI
ncbi:hypothetical protein BKA62DRAFT_612996 [Auriculariales sp. MPI-PUGE-AT-0066]|nr:hypothetical protein BKA62DRAFT_612996 [Auriculariales sp. MPI-PUGE-AT-0066]